MNSWSQHDHDEDEGDESEGDTVDEEEEISEISDNYDRNLRQEILEAQRKRGSRGRERERDPLPNALYEDDYTDSTASTASMSASASVESIEQFMNSVRSASSSTNNIRATMNDELETYHPRMDGIRALSPYRSPEPGQAAVILNKPLPLPDPDYVPKPILKRPTNENHGTGEREKAKEVPVVIKSSPKPPPKVEKVVEKIEKLQKPEKPERLEKADKPDKAEKIQKPTKPEKSEKPEKPEKPEKAEKIEKPEKTEKRGFLQLFERKKASSAENVKNKKPIDGQPSPSLANVTLKLKALEKEKKMILHQNSLEENKVAIDHYSDLVRELGGRDKPKVPLYMNSEALREAAERAEWEEKQAAAAAATAKAAQEQQEALALAKADEEEAARVQELANKLKQFQEPSPCNERSRSSSSSFQKDMVEISVEQTKSITYSLREIKQDPTMNMDSTVNSDMMRKTSRSGSGVRSKTLARMRSTSASRGNSVTAEILDRNGIDTRGDRRSHSKSPISQHRTSLTSTVLRVKRMPIQEQMGNIDIDLSPSVSPEPRCQTPDELQAVAESNVKSSLSYTTDLAMFLFACWLYVFKDARWAIPVLTLMVYRQVRSAVEKKLQKWTKRKLKNN